LGPATGPVSGLRIVAYKRIPSDVVAPIMQMLDWLLWLVLLLCLAWLIVSAGRLWLARGALQSDAGHGVLMSLVGAIVASSATSIALALLPA
jgi:hypothetical protein